MLSLQVSRSGHGQQLLAVSRRSGWLPLSLWQKQRKNLSRCGKPHKGAGMGFFSGAWITEHPPKKVICWVNAHCRTGCIRRGRKRRKKSGLRSSLDTFGSSPGSVPLGRASSLYYKQKYMQQLQLLSVISWIVRGAGGILNSWRFLAIWWSELKLPCLSEWGWARSLLSSSLCAREGIRLQVSEGISVCWGIPLP